jgi:hypothetical protein
MFKSSPQRWTESRARDYFQSLPWLVGCNYIPRTAVNQLEMWQAETFDAQTIDQELTWAAAIGFNSVRVFLHDLLYTQDAAGFFQRIDQFLSIAQDHDMGAMFVLFDSCWHPHPRSGPQRPPEPGVHNSGWVQSPGIDALRDPAQFDRLEPYVRGLLSRFGDDRRIHAWDIWNEPDNFNPVYGTRDIGPQKEQLVEPLLARAFAWARAANTSQPLTCGVWNGNWESDQSMKPLERLQIELSDIISFHCYHGDPAVVEKMVADLGRFKRPLLCTEYMARGVGSTFETCLPVLKKHRVGAYNWGLVAGKSQTHFPWDSWTKLYDPAEPPLWFHDIFRPDGSPYLQTEVDQIRKLTGGNDVPGI